MKTTTSINPATEEEVATYNRISKKKIANKITAAHKTYQSWKKTDFKERAALMHQLATILETKKEKFAKIATEEMGKTIAQSRKEIEKCALVCRYYADNAEELLANQIVDTEAANSYVTYQPLGVVLAIMPWNFPFYQVIRFAAPALMAGIQRF